MKITVPTDHESYKGLKVGDALTIHCKVIKMGESGAECDVDSCEKDGKPMKKKTAMKPVDYLRAKRRGEM